MPGEPFSPERLIEEALRYVRMMAPGKLPAPLRITIGIEGGPEVGTLFVPVARAAAPPGPSDHTPPPAAPRFNDMEQDVLDALAEAPGELTGEQIAARAGYSWESPLRRCLASLRRRGVLTGEAGERGYRLASPPAPSV